MTRGYCDRNKQRRDQLIILYLFKHHHNQWWKVEKFQETHMKCSTFLATLSTVTTGRTDDGAAVWLCLHDKMFVVKDWLQWNLLTSRHSGCCIVHRDCLAVCLTLLLAPYTIRRRLMIRRWQSGVLGHGYTRPPAGRCRCARWFQPSAGRSNHQLPTQTGRKNANAKGCGLGQNLHQSARLVRRASCVT